MNSQFLETKRGDVAWRFVTRYSELELQLAVKVSCYEIMDDIIYLKKIAYLQACEKSLLK